MAAGLAVTARVAMPEGQARAAQRMVAMLGVPPGPSAPWLQERFPGATLSNIVSPLKCSDALCELCMDGAGLLTRDRCTKCVQSSGSAGTADFYSVYRRANSTCSLCPRLCRVCNQDGTCAQCWAADPGMPATSVYRASSGYCKPCNAVPNCKQCSTSGACAVCAAGYTLAGSACRRQCTQPVCRSCEQVSANVCDPDGCTTVLINGYSVYRNTSGQCSLCTARLCSRCLATGACSACKASVPGRPTSTVYQNSQGVCTECPLLCTRCLPSGQCAACKAAAPSGSSVYMNKRGLCIECTRPNCAACNSDGTCKACRAGHSRTAQGVCVCALPNCLKCADGTTCTACKTGFSRTVAGQCRRSAR